MAEIIIDFEWPVAADYEIVQQPKKPGTQKSRSRVLTGELIYPRVKPKPGPIKTKKPIELHPTLFLSFAAIDPTPENCLLFAQDCGLLGFRLSEEGESCAQWRDEIGRMRFAVHQWQSGNLWPETDCPKEISFAASLVKWPAPEGGYRVKNVPTSLRNALWLQFFKAVESNKAIRACDSCGNWFETGANTGRRRGARFCTNRCRDEYHNRRRAKGGSQ